MGPRKGGDELWAKIVPEQGLRRWARFLRRYHDAVAEYRPPGTSVWSSVTGRCAPGQLVCHGDLWPGNGVWRGDEVVGLIDFDHARPASPLFDIAYALEYAAPFRDDTTCVRWLRYPHHRTARRIEVSCDAYGIAAPNDVADLVADQQRSVLATVRQLARRSVEPQATWVADGYLDELHRRIRWTESVML
ncbi:MAG: phosphotransferase [Egibacteraceae bacterium]